MVPFLVLIALQASGSSESETSKEKGTASDCGFCIEFLRSALSRCHGKADCQPQWQDCRTACGNSECDAGDTATYPRKLRVKAATPLMALQGVAPGPDVWWLRQRQCRRAMESVSQYGSIKNVAGKWGGDAKTGFLQEACAKHMTATIDCNVGLLSGRYTDVSTASAACEVARFVAPDTRYVTQAMCPPNDAEGWAIIPPKNSNSSDSKMHTTKLGSAFRLAKRLVKGTASLPSLLARKLRSSNENETTSEDDEEDEMDDSTSEGLEDDSISFPEHALQFLEDGLWHPVSGLKGALASALPLAPYLPSDSADWRTHIGKNPRWAFDQLDLLRNSGAILLSDVDGNLYVENVPKSVRMALKSMYQGAGGVQGVLGRAMKDSAMLELMTFAAGTIYTDPKNAEKSISKYVRDYNPDLSIVEGLQCGLDEPEGSCCDGSLGFERIDCTKGAQKLFRTYNDFFSRKLVPDSRDHLCYDDYATCAKHRGPDDGVIISPADARMIALPLSGVDEIWVKGSSFTLQSLVSLPEEDYAYWEGGTVYIARLAPQDYHRFHFPCDGIVCDAVDYPGRYWSVSPIAVRAAGTNVLAENKRMHALIGNEDLGCVLYVSVGATMVGSVVHTSHIGQRVKKGMEHGFMQFGGSTVIVVVPKGGSPVPAVVANSQLGVETILRVGEVVGQSYVRRGVAGSPCARHPACGGTVYSDQKLRWPELVPEDERHWGERHSNFPPLNVLKGKAVVPCSAACSETGVVGAVLLFGATEEEAARQCLKWLMSNEKRSKGTFSLCTPIKLHRRPDEAFVWYPGTPSTPGTSTAPSMSYGWKQRVIRKSE